MLLKAMRSTMRSGFRCLAVLIFAAAALAGAARAQGSDTKAGGAIRVTVDGELRAATTGSDIKGSDADRFTLRVTRISDRTGVVLPELIGTTLRFKRNPRSVELVTRHAPGTRVTITGKLDLDKRLLEVESYKPASSAPKGSTTKD